MATIRDIDQDTMWNAIHAIGGEEATEKVLQAIIRDGNAAEETEISALTGAKVTAKQTSEPIFIYGDWHTLNKTFFTMTFDTDDEAALFRLKYL